MERLVEKFGVDGAREQIPVELRNAVRFEWPLWARPKQIAPAWNWLTWLVLAGRGFGKTRIGAEWVRGEVKRYPIVNLIGATADDARDIMIDGESGVLAVCPRWERPIYKKSERKLVWPNGAVSLVFTADEPDRLRGKQHMKVWADEVAAWRYLESWDQMTLGLRLGDAPQALATTTPRPIKLIRDLIKDPTTHVTRGSTLENKRNLARAFIDKLIKKYHGTRLGRQELNAEILDDIANALWKRVAIDEGRVLHAPDCDRVVVAIDPATTSDEDSAETGIVVGGRKGDDFYVLEDASLRGTPTEWAERAVKVARHHQADRIIGEANNGGDLIETVLRTVDKNISYTKVTASRGKVKRAEPVAALYEQGRGHHVGSFPELEDQMCTFVQGEDPEVSPDRADALVWAGTALMLEGDEAEVFLSNESNPRRG